MKKIIILLFTLIVFVVSYNVALAGNNKDFEPKGASETISLYGDLKAYKVLFGKWGIYNSRGIVTFPMYDDIVNGNEFIFVKMNGAWGALDHTATMVVDPLWDELTEYRGKCLRISKNGLYGWIYTDRNYIQIPIYRQVEYAGGDLFGVCNNTGCGVVNSRNQIIIPLNHKETFSNLASGYFAINYNGRIGIADIHGNTILDCVCPDMIYSSDSNVIVVQNFSNKSRGLLRLYDGKRIAETKYADIVPIKENPGYFKVKYNGKWGAVDYDGNNIFPCNYGPLEMNRMIRNLPRNKNFVAQYEYNKYYSELGSAYFEYYENYKLSSYTKKKIDNILTNTSVPVSIKNKTKEFLNMYRISL